MLTADSHGPCGNPACLCDQSPAFVPVTTPLQAKVAALQAGDVVRVRIANNGWVTGKLRASGRSVLQVEAPRLLFLDVPAGHLIRTANGTPGWSVVDVEVITEDDAFDALDEAIQEYHCAYLEHRDAVKADRDRLAVRVEEAKTAVLRLWGWVL